MGLFQQRLYDIKNIVSSYFYSSVSEKKYPYYLAKIYKKRTGETLNWDNLRTYNEKMQWAKIYDNNELKTLLSDKYLVRNWVEKIIGKEYLIPLLGVWDSFDEINFDQLPDQFVLKTNHGSGTNIIVENKSLLNKRRMRKKINKWMKINYAYKNGFQLQYKDIKPKIIAEKYMRDNEAELKDYKFLCFSGKVHYCWVDEGRFSDHRRNIYNLNWELQEWKQHYYKNTDTPIEKPQNFEGMVEIAQRLCQGFSHVRVDLYNLNGKIYFGEMTFTNSSGFEKIYPKEYNLMLGDLWELKR